MTSSNQEQIDYWNGNAGTQWTTAQEQLDAMLSPMSEQALAIANVQADERVLDIGCGCGATSLALAETAIAVTGVDISAPMVARAQQRAASMEHVAFIEADASTWRAEQPVDLAFSRFGVMFFADPVAAFTNIHANIAANGRLCFICWRLPKDNPWLAVPAAAAAPFLPDAPAPDGPGPFAFADQDFVRDLLHSAGFRDVAFNLCEADLRLGSDVDAALQFQSRIGPLSRVMAELEGDAQQQALDAVAAALQPYQQADGLKLGASCWTVTANA
ncbi:MAG: class I SAM-dependent methyltransferase [Pseudomonadales bacterium]